ncbi:MAG: hypothetical protein ACREMY_01405, partial [bacterium]
PGKCGVGGFLGKTQQQIALGESFTSKTTAGAPRIAGECATSKPEKMFDDVYEFRLMYDTTLTAIPKPASLPAGGGELGKALLALIKAIRDADWNGAHLRLQEQEVPKTPPKAAEMKDYFHSIGLNYPKSATVSGGLMKGDRANLDIQGTDQDGKKIRGVFAMKKVAGNWRVIDRNMFFAQ